MGSRWAGRLALGMAAVLGAASIWHSLGAPPAAQAAQPRVVCLPVVANAPSTGEALYLAPGAVVPLVRVPAGSFVMGAPDSDTDAEGDERPQHAVYLDEYLIGQYEVTVAQWRAFVSATSYAGDARALADGDDYPVRYVSYLDVEAFCSWASQATDRNVHLPTEAQWEKAARGTDGRTFPWGDNPPFCLLCNLWTCVRDTAPIGSCSPAGDSVYGCADMAGNLWEWTFDYYDWGYYSVSPLVNPTGPAGGYTRGARGGAWSYPARDVRTTNRHEVSAPFARDEYVGFRLAVAVPQGGH